MRLRLVLALVPLIASTTACSHTTVRSFADDRGFRIVEITGAIDDAGAARFSRHLRQADQQAPRAIVVVIDSPGGLQRAVDVASSALADTRCPTYALVRKAVFGAAMLALASDRVYMTPEGRIGSVVLVYPRMDQQDLQSATAEMERRMVTLASAEGHDPAVARAMVNPDLEFKVGNQVLSPRGTVLVLNAAEASMISPSTGRPVLSEGTFSSWQEMVASLGEQP